MTVPPSVPVSTLLSSSVWVTETGMSVETESPATELTGENHTCIMPHVDVRGPEAGRVSRLNMLFSLVAGQVCQCVWQQVCKIMVLLLGEESKKSSFFAHSLGSGRLFATGCDPVGSVRVCLFLLEDMTFFSLVTDRKGTRDGG